MALKVGELFATINLRDEGFNSGLSSAMSSLAKAAATAVATMKVFDTLKLGVNYNADIEQLQTSFEVMTGSAEKAAAIVSEIRTLGAQTPFEMTGLAETTQLLMNYGLTADNAIDSMLMLGDVAQGDQTKLTRIATAFGQMSSAGKVQLQDIKQMIEAGYNPLQEISESTGESMASLYDRISKGTISVDEITASMKRSTSAGGKYFKSMEKQSKTLNGQISTLQDNLMQLLGSAVQPISDVLRDSVLPTAIDVVEQIQAAFDEDGFAGIGDLVAKTITQSLRRIRTEAAPAIRSAFEKLWSAARESGTALKDNLEMVIQNAPEYVRSTAKRVKGSFANIDWNGIWNGIQNSAEHLRISINNVLVRVPVFLKRGISIFKTTFSNINWDSLWNGISNSYDAMKTKATELISKIPEVINGLLSAGSEFVNSEAFSGIGESISGLIAAAIQNKSGSGLANIVTAISGVFSQINWDDAGAIVGDVGSVVLSGIVESINAAATGVGILVDAISELITSALSSKTLSVSVTSLATVGDKLIGAIVDGINITSDAVSPVIIKISNAISGVNWESVGATLGGLATSLINSLTTALGENQTSFGTLVSNIGIMIGNAAAGLKDAAIGLVKKLIEYMLDPSAWVSLGKGLTTILNGIFGGLMGIFEQLLGDFTASDQGGEIDYTLLINADGEIDVGQAIDLSRYAGSGDAMIQYLKDNGFLPEGAVERYDFALQLFPEITYNEALDNTNTEVVQALIEAGMSTDLLNITLPVFATPDFTLSGDSAAVFQESITNSLSESGITPNVEAEFNVEVSSVQAATLGEEAKAQFGTAGTEAGNILNQNAATAIANTAGIEGAIATLSAAASSAASSGLRTAGMTGGKMFSSGLAAGILSGKSAITSAARKVAQAAIDAANAKLKIASPSRVMMESGGYFSEGFAKGIMNAAKMATSAASGMAGMAASAATIRRPVGGLSYAGATVSGGAAVIDYDKMAEAMSQYQMAMYMNGRRVAEINAANTARAQNNRQNSIALGYGINRR